MPTLDDVRSLAMSLPETSEKLSWGRLMWRVKDKGFVWERPLNKSDLAALAELGREVPEGELIGLRVADEAEKQALIASDPAIYLTIPHFDGYPAVLARLEAITDAELREMILEAWLDRAPKRLAQAYLAEHPDPPA